MSSMQVDTTQPHAPISNGAVIVHLWTPFLAERRSKGKDDDERAIYIIVAEP